jgi:hypothetical protein
MSSRYSNLQAEMKTLMRAYAHNVVDVEFIDKPGDLDDDDDDPSRCSRNSWRLRLIPPVVCHSNISCHVNSFMNISLYGQEFCRKVLPDSQRVLPYI